VFVFNAIAVSEDNIYAFRFELEILERGLCHISRMVGSVRVGEKSVRSFEIYSIEQNLVHTAQFYVNRDEFG